MVSCIHLKWDANVNRWYLFALQWTGLASWVASQIFENRVWWRIRSELTKLLTMQCNTRNIKPPIAPRFLVWNSIWILTRWWEIGEIDPSFHRLEMNLGLVASQERPLFMAAGLCLFRECCSKLSEIMMLPFIRFTCEREGRMVSLKTPHSPSPYTTTGNPP